MKLNLIPDQIRSDPINVSYLIGYLIRLDGLDDACPPINNPWSVVYLYTLNAFATRKWMVVSLDTFYEPTHSRLKC